MTDGIRETLFSLQDAGYRDFQSKLIPTVDPDTIIGVRTPELRTYAKQLAKQDLASGFLRELPHRYFEENQLHAFIVSQIKDFGRCLDEVSGFLPFVDNWATCDQMSPAVFKKHRTQLLAPVREWISSENAYSVRFAVKMLMEHFLDDDFDPSYPTMVAGIKSDEYYVNMMRAWYFATALAKQYDAVLPFIEKRVLDTWTHNKAIQKACESYRVAESQKAHLKQLKRKKSDMPRLCDPSETAHESI